jgi:translation elongation factor EF-1alpha
VILRRDRAQGPTLLEVLDSREVAVPGGDRPVRIPINEKYRDGEARPHARSERVSRVFQARVSTRQDADLGRIAPEKVYCMGKLEYGTVRTGDTLALLPAGTQITVLQVFEEEQDVPESTAGAIVRLRVKGASEDDIHVRPRPRPLLLPLPVALPYSAFPPSPSPYCVPSI